MDIENTITNEYPQAPFVPSFAEAQESTPLPEHLIHLPGGDWSVWRCVALRGAGFPASGVLKLSAPECAAAADALIEAESGMEAVREEALTAIRGELDALRLEAPSDEADRRALLNKALRNVKRGKVPAQTGFSPKTEQPLNRIASAGEAVERARDEFRESFETATANIVSEIVSVARSDRFREAVLWQNRRALHSGLDALLNEVEEKGRRGSKQRQHEELVASYLNRYSVKNDTIGFFGPVGWARVVDHEDWLVSRPGPNLVNERNVYFEGWGIDKLTEVLAKDAALLPWATPRLMPFIHIDGTTLYIPFQKPLPISAEQAVVLQACDGERTAKEIAESLLEDRATGIQSCEEVFGILDTLKAKGMIAWTMEVPLRLNPDQRFRSIVERIADDRLRQPILEKLDELEAARIAVAGAAGDSGCLNQALENLDQTFTRLTGAAPLQSGTEGKTYSARTLVYEDCRRDIDVEIGTEFLSALGEPLSLLLTSARWLTQEVGADLREIFEDLYEDLAQQDGSPVVEAVKYWYHLIPLLFEGEQSPVDPLLPGFQQKWAEVLRLSETEPGDGSTERRLHYTCEELRARVAAAFRAAVPGWVSARYHSPDVMVAATDTDAVRRGEYELVLGEMHLGENTIAATLFVAQHPSPEDLLKFYDADFPETRMVAVWPKSWPQSTARTQVTICNPRDRLLVGTQDSLGAPKSQALNIGSLVVERTPDGLVIRTRDGRLRFDIVEAFGDILSMLVVNAFKILPPRRHTPRITFDRLVVSRETWRFNPEEADFAWEKTEAERFLSARRWRQSKGMPRFIFYKSPVESKPAYVDFDSPIGIEMFSRAIRRTAENAGPDSILSASEMLPGPDQNWLRDQQGNAFTSEFRIVAVDPARKPGHTPGSAPA